MIDCSGSMSEGYRLERAKEEMRKSVDNMRFPQRFHVIFYNSEPIAMPGDLIRSADFGNKTALSHWLARIDAEGETDPRGSQDGGFASTRRDFLAHRRRIPRRDRGRDRQIEQNPRADPLR